MKNKVRDRIESIFPVGINYVKEIKWSLTGLIISVIYSLGFFFKLYDNYDKLFKYTYDDKKVIIDGIFMEDCINILDGCFALFVILIICTFSFCVYHYAYHYINSKSIYLMKRLPQKYELLKRCIVSPIIALLLIILIVIILIVLYYWIYTIVTPKQCIAPGQWQSIWKNIIKII